MTDAEVLAAFREVTGWSDALVLHYATSLTCVCVPICGHEEVDCPVADRLYGYGAVMDG